MFVETVCSQKVHFAQYNKHLKECDICSSTVESIFDGTFNEIIQEIVNKSDLIPAKFRDLFSKEVIYLSPSLFRQVFSYVIANKIFPTNSQYRCPCGFMCRTRKSFAIHAKSCRHYKEKLQEVLNVHLLREKLKKQSLFEYVQQFPWLSYHDALNVVRDYVKNNLLDYAFLDECKKRQAYRHVFKEGLEKKYDVDNPSRLQFVREKQRLKQLNLWYDFDKKISRLNTAYSEQYSNVLQYYNCTTYEELIRKIYDEIRSSSSTELLDPHDFDVYVMNRMGDGNNTFKFRCKKCNLVYLRYVPSLISIAQSLVLYSVSVNELLGCPVCYRKSNKSLLEKEIIAAIKQTFPHHDITVKEHVRINRKEIDILIEYNDRKLGIEADGLYWHSTAYLKSRSNSFYEFLLNVGKQKEQVQQKIDFLLGLDFSTLVIDEFSWTTHKESWLSMIGYKLGLLNSIYARKCQLIEISEHVANSFHQNYNIHGKIKGAYKHVALSLNDRIVAVASFGRTRFDRSNMTELLRLTYKPFMSIVGGFSKLLSSINGNIVSYVDGRFRNLKPEGKLLTVPQLTYYIIDWHNRQLHHRLWIRKHIDDNKELEFIFNSPQFDFYYTIGSWKVLLKKQKT